MKLDFDAIAAHEQQLLDYATEQLLSIDGLRIIGTAKDKASLVSFDIEKLVWKQIAGQKILDLMGLW